MWDEAKQMRMEQLFLAESQRSLTDQEHAEFAALVSERRCHEEAAIGRATRRTEANVALLEQQVQRVRDQNQELAALIQEQEAYLAQVQATIAQMEERRRNWRERYEHVTGKPLEEPITVETRG